MKRVIIALDFDYDRGHDDDLMDLVRVSQISSELSESDALEQVENLCQSDFGWESLPNAVMSAISGQETTFKSHEN